MRRSLTNKGCTAVTAMLHLALLSRSAPVALFTLSRRQQVSLSTLEQLFGLLRRHGLVRGTRGAGGGYVLGRGAAEISVADIVLAVDPPVAGAPGRTDAGGDTAARCAAHALGVALDAKRLECLASIALQQLVDAQLARGVPAETPAAPSIKRGISSRPVLRPIRVAVPNSVFALAGALWK